MRNRRTVTAEAGHQTIAFMREFEAPAARVFEAHTDAGLIAQWIGPRGTTLRMRQFDPRTGGSWSYVIAGKGGEWAFTDHSTRSAPRAASCRRSSSRAIPSTRTWSS